MPRSYSEAFMIELHQANPQLAGVKLAKACIKANIPAQYIAEKMGVSRMTIYNWFRGKSLRGSNERKVWVLIERIKDATEKGELPATTYAKAKEFVAAANLDPQ